MSGAFRLGAFIVGTLAVLATAVFLIGDKDLLFSSTYNLQAQFQNVSGLGNGADVRVGGIHQGTVRAIRLPAKPDQKVTVVMGLNTGTRSIVKKDSVAAIKSEGLLGDKYVEVSFGSNDAERLKNGDTIGSAPPLDISDLIQKTNDILDTTKSAMGNVETTTDNLQAISTKIKQGKGTMGAMINDKTMYQEATAGATAFAENMEALKHNFFLRGFFRKRGYEDSDELTKHQISRLPTETPSKKFEYEASQIFTNADTAKLKGQKSLNEAGKFLEGNTYGLVVVAASSGMKGDTDKDRLLTEAQSMVVRDYLTKTFQFDDTRVKTLGLGKTAQNGSGSKLQILVYPAGTNVASSQSQAASQNPVAKH